MGYIGYDLVNVVQDFIRSSTLPKSIILTNLAFLHNCLKYFLDILTYSNQSEFVKGGIINDNVLLEHEIISNIMKRGRPIM